MAMECGRRSTRSKLKVIRLIHTLASGRKVKQMALGCTPGLMETDMKASGISA